ncbi:hypothetical protein PR202_gb05095 [Eleusine coracana subsp. coracana]|uniref:Uncharacterized protein n=1 Tax=Eleusine coracana subsp. coracana TaxID=191504 RepID=A0AAV5E3N8_ELECO|nr:hypothetical protein PR202_gb05095 [Eleusine coracana subsp. coracana]
MTTRKQAAAARAQQQRGGPAALKRGPWSLIAGRLPGRTDNEIKNYWNSHLSKKLIAQGIDPRTHKPLNAAAQKFNSNSIIAAAAAATIKKPPVATTGGNDFAAAMVGLDADGGFEGFGVGDEFRACWDTAPPPRGGGGGDWGCPMVDDGTFSSFLDSLIDDEDQLVYYLGGDHKNSADADKDRQGGAS